MKDHVHAITPEGVKEKMQDKTNDSLKNASKIANSPESKIIGKLGGDNVSDGIKTTAKVIDSISKESNIVGDKNAENNKKQQSLTQPIGNNQIMNL